MMMTTAIMCMALNIYWEARGEFIPGQYAVASVTLNRAGSDKNICRVVTEPNQFSWTTKLVDYRGKVPVLKPAGYPKDERAWALAQHIAKYAMKNRVDFVDGANHYHATSVRPKWVTAQAVRTHRFGKHIFYRLPTKSQLTGHA